MQGQGENRLSLPERRAIRRGGGVDFVADGKVFRGWTTSPWVAQITVIAHAQLRRLAHPSFGAPTHMILLEVKGHRGVTGA